jgi:site-specific DNA recombinase
VGSIILAPNNKTKKAMLGIYARISRDKEETDRSIEDQIQTGIELAEKLKLSYRIYREADGTSGSLPIDKRPQLQSLVDDILSNEINAVYAYDQSRLERNVETNFILKKLFKEFKVKLYFQGGLQTQSLETDLAGDIISRVNQYYLEITKKKIKSVLNRNAKEGRCFSFIQFGYMEGNDKKLIVNEAEAEIVKRIFAFSLEGVGTAKIAEILNAEGVPTRYNQKEGSYKVVNRYTKEVSIRQKVDVKWKGGTIRGIIINPIYKGERRWNDTTYPAPQIVEEWYWQKVNDNLKNNSNNRGQSVRHSYLLKGLLRCGKCGANYYGRTRVAKEGKKPKDNYYMCSSKRKGEHNCGNRSLNIEVLDSLIWSKLVFDGRFRNEILNHFEQNDLYQERKGIESEISALIDVKEKINYQRTNIYLALGQLGRDIKEASEALTKLQSEAVKVDQEIRILETKLDEISLNFELKNEYIEELNKVSNLSLEGKRDLISKFIKNIKIDSLPKGVGYFVNIEFKIFGMKDAKYYLGKPYELALKCFDDVEKIVNKDFSNADLNFEIIYLKEAFKDEIDEFQSSNIKKFGGMMNVDLTKHFKDEN